ncbi:hypothetical protein [Rubellicoccus peritrichatus]|uniref:Uncharacterized protein n=1 Tax=Rubellicoccus peritrichatus TaxID=3080537 RepID=A0AAQ3QQD3_9BACT|nr:hypothetical protein [Puniceicoccus sp. CR14]WOO40118.1 hypothetical protein RZN69_15970 [Puniceicoccus sp. CR14]
MSGFARAITLTGSNGRSADFIGVMEATPQGLVVLQAEGQQSMTLSWDRLDLIELEENHPKIYNAYTNATSYGKTVPLQLGIYKEYLSYKQALVKLAKDFDRPYSVRVPDYQEYVEAYNRLYYNYGGVRDYYDHAKDRRKIYENYREFLQSFFRGKDIQLDVSQSSYSQNVFSATPNRSSVKITSTDLVAFFADKNNKSRKEAMVYIHNYRDTVNHPLEILKDLSQKVPNPLFDRNEADQVYLETLLNNNIEELEHLITEKAFPHSALRNFEKLLATIEEGRKLQK